MAGTSPGRFFAAGVGIFLERDSIYEYSHLAELPAARVRVPRGKIYSPFIGQTLSRGVQISGWRGVGGEGRRVACVAKYMCPYCDI